jgi:hypothetical protein
MGVDDYLMIEHQVKEQITCEFRMKPMLWNYELLPSGG